MNISCDLSLTRKEQAELTRQKIAQTAIDLIRKNGYSKVNVSDICKRAGVSVGSFYHYFSSKSVLATIYDRSDAALVNRIKTIGLSGNTQKKLLTLFEFQVDYVVNEFGLEMLDEMFKGRLENLSDGNVLFFSKKRPLYTNVDTLIRIAMESGELKMSRPPEFITNDILRFFRGILYDWCARSGSYNLLDNVQESMGFYIHLLFSHNH